MEHTDIRFADQLDLGDTPITYGISLNNNPTVQDLWNTTPAWGFPYTGSGIQPRAIVCYLRARILLNYKPC